MRIDRVVRLLVPFFSVIALTGLPSAASADVEPNDGITQTEGPLRGGTVYAGTLFSDNDSDWYAFYDNGQTQLDVAVTTPADSPCDAVVQLRDTDGGFVDEAEADQDTTEHILYTTPPGSARYLIRVYPGCAGTKYQFRLDPAAAIVDGPGRQGATPTGEPNETAGQAAGPMGGGAQYSGAIQTSNDSDFFFFYTSGNQPFDLAVTTTDGCSADVRLFEEDGESDALTASPSVDSTEHIRVTPPGPRRYVIEVTGCIGTTYELRLDPPGAIAQSLPVAAPPPPPPPPLPPTLRPVMTLSAANGYARRALRTRYGRAFTKGKRFKRRCKRVNDPKFRCSVSWRYKRYAYKGSVRVYYLVRAGKVYWNAKYSVRRRRA